MRFELELFSTDLTKCLCATGGATGNGSNVSSQGRLGHVIRLGPLSPLLNIVLRAELRLDDVLWVRSRRTRTIITLRRRLATELACPVRPKGLTTALFNRNSTSCLICFVADVLSWLRLRTVFRASKPYRHVAGIRSPRSVSQLDTWFMSETAMNT